MSTFKSARRRAADAGRRAADNVQQRNVTVTLVVTQYDRSVNLQGAVASTTTSTTLTPNPKVVPAGGDPSFYGGSTDVLAGGDQISDQYVIGPVTREYDGGGYAQDTLVPAASASKTVRYRLSGENFITGGELFRPVKIERATPHSLWVLVERTSQ